MPGIAQAIPGFAEAVPDLAVTMPGIPNAMYIAIAVAMPKIAVR